MQQGGDRFLPWRGCDASDPHNEKEMPQGGFKCMGHNAEQFIRDAVCASGFIIAEFSKNGIKCMLAEDVR